MLTEILPFRIELNTTLIAGSCLWSLALYLGFASFREWVIDSFYRWFNFAERSLYISEEEFERTRKARESQNAFFASLSSIVPFFIIGALCNWGVEISLGQSWSVSVGILACIACGIYDLGRRDGQK
jgi:hypothetical protein